MKSSSQIQLDARPYFLQSQQWADAWQAANGAGHTVHHLRLPDSDIECWVYQYPYIAGQTFLFIPKAPVTRMGIISPLDFQRLCSEIQTLAGKLHVVFVKWELPVPDALSSADISHIIKKPVVPSNPIQFAATMELDLGSIQDTSMPNTPAEALQTYYANQVFWKQRSTNIQRYSKKSLAHSWQFSTTKNTTNFDAFWQVHSSTADAQGFAPYPYSYYHALYMHDSSKIIVIWDEDGQPQSVWFGWLSSDSLVYLYGGNSQYARTHKAQYAMHVMAVQMAAAAGVGWYDFGGYDTQHGYSHFKAKYKGNIRYFGDTVDVIFRPVLYHVISVAQKIRKKLKSV